MRSSARLVHPRKPKTPVLQFLHKQKKYNSFTKIQYCTCKAFPSEQFCFHSLALGLRAGRRRVPVESDTTPLCQSTRGKRAKMGDRYSVDEVAKQVCDKDGLMVRLASFSGVGCPPLNRPACATVAKRPAGAATAPSLAQPSCGPPTEKRRRFRGKGPSGPSIPETAPSAPPGPPAVNSCSSGPE